MHLFEMPIRFFITIFYHLGNHNFSENLMALREKKKREERAESQKANEAITKCLGEYHRIVQ